MDTVELDVSLREGSGKSAARKLRQHGIVPGVLYGFGVDTTSISVDASELERIVSAGSNTILDLQGPKEVTGKLVLVKELQRDPVSHRVVHCDFYAVDTTKKISVNVPIHVDGKARGVDMGGVLESVTREVEVECMPLDIPDSLSVDISALEIGDSIHVSDLVAPANALILEDAGKVVVHVMAPRVEEEPVAEEEAAEEGEAPAEGEAAADGAATGDSKTEKADKGEESGN